MRYAFDTSVLGVLAHPGDPDYEAVRDWVRGLMYDPGVRLYLPAVADYELRRELVRIDAADPASPSRAGRLDALRGFMTFLGLSDAAGRRAAALWADVRAGQGKKGKGKTASDMELDGDVLVAAQALEVDAAVVTKNVRHISRYCVVVAWETIPGVRVDAT